MAETHEVFNQPEPGAFLGAAGWPAIRTPGTGSDYKTIIARAWSRGTED